MIFADRTDAGERLAKARQPASSPTSLVASPSKKRDIGPRNGASDGK